MTALAQVGLLTAIATFVAAWFGPQIKLGAVLTMMFAITLFGAKVVDYPFGTISNVTNAPYAAVIVLLAILSFRRGWRFTRTTIGPVFGG